MIMFSISIRNPWTRDYEHHDYFYRHRKLTKNKTFEIQIYRSSSYNLFRFFAGLTWRGEDHAGPELEIELGRFAFNMKIYDHRHWNYKTGTWEVYDPNAPQNDWDYR